MTLQKMLKFGVAFVFVLSASNVLALPAPNETNDSDEVIIDAKCYKDHTIKNAGELGAIANCEVIGGSIVFSNYQDAMLDLGDMSVVTGSLIVENSNNLVVIKGSNLDTVDGSFELRKLTSLQEIQLPKLTAVNNMEWKVLPLLSKLSLPSSIKSLQSLTISDTSLSEFTGFVTEKVRILNINNNRFMERIRSPIKEVTEQLSISANAKGLDVSLPSLAWVSNITLRDAASVDLSNLQVVESSAEFIDNDFRSLKLPKLKTTGGTLSIIENQFLKEVDFPAMTEVSGGLMVVNNPQVTKLNFFPALSSIGGAIKFSGNFVETNLEKLKVVKGSALVNTTSQFDCDKWLNQGNGQVVRGVKVECTAGEGDDQVSLVGSEAKGFVTRKGRTQVHPSTSSASSRSLPPMVAMIMCIVTVAITGF